MHGGWGIDAAIHNTCGQEELNKEVDQYFTEQNKTKEAELILTSGGKIKERIPCYSCSWT